MPSRRARAGTVVVEARPVQVVDTVGAGDAFMTGLIDALWSLDLLGASRRAALAGISTDTLEGVLRAASQVSARRGRACGRGPPRSRRAHGADGSVGHTGLCVRSGRVPSPSAW